MKFANIDDAITEAAKKPVPKVASPKADPKKVAPKKVDPKETPAPVAPTKKPAAPKKAAAPVAVPKKKATSSEVPKTVVKKKKSVAPAPAAEPETREEPATEPEQKPAEPKPTQGSDSSERPKFASRWLQSKPRGIGDRLKSAWKGFTAKSGQDLGKAGTSYKSVFHEIHKLMEQLQLVEAMLQEQSLNESYDAGTVNNLYEHRNTIRSVLVEQIVREELYTHNVTIAELDRRQRAALMKTVNVRANALWEGMNQMEDSYTLEEWMGMMKEAGYSLDEKNMNQMTRDERDHAIASSRDVVQKKVKGTSPADVKAAQHAATVAQLLKRLGRAQTGTPEMEEGKLSRLAAGLGLAGAAMMGSPNDAGAQQSQPTQAPTAQVPNDSVQTGNSRDMQLAINNANYALDRKKISQTGARRDVVKNPDGTYTATVDARKQPNSGAPQMEDKYTLEEWMGMMKESGANVEEGFMDTLRKGAAGVGKAVSKVAGKAADAAIKAGDKLLGTGTVSYDVPKGYHWSDNPIYAKSNPAEVEKQKQAAKKIKDIAAQTKAGTTAPDDRSGTQPFPINENTVSRLQQLAGIKPIK